MGLLALNRSYGTPLQQGWEKAGSFLIDEAHQIFRNKEAHGRDAEPERQLGEALTLLNTQPRTARNLNRARELFTQLADGEGEAAIFSAYFLARMAELYVEPPRLDEARERYRAVLTRYPGHPVAERGASALVLIDLYEPISDEERAARFAALEKLGPKLQTPTGKREFHLNIGNAYIYFPKADPHHARALAHLQKADEIGIPRWQIESTTWIAIGELARARGDVALAARYYRKFLDEYPRDNRHYTIGKQLEEILSEPASPTPREGGVH